MHKKEFNDILYVWISKRKLSELGKYAKMGRQFEEVKHNKRNQSSPTRQHILAMAALYTPKIGMEAISTVIALSTAAFVANIGCNQYYLTNIVYCCPLSTYLKQLLI